MVTLLRRAKSGDPDGSGAAEPGPAAGWSHWLAAHRSVVGLVGMAVLVGGAAVGYLTLSGDDADPGPGSAAGSTSLPVPRRSPTPGSPSPSGSGQATVGEMSTMPDPFRALAGSGAPSSAGTGSPTAAGTGSPSSTGTGSPSPSTSLPKVPTVTVTASPAPSIYLGLYGWTAAGLPMFRANTLAATPSVGQTFLLAFQYLSKETSQGITCAKVKYRSTTQRICPGQVVQVS